MKCVSLYNHNFTIYRWGWREGEKTSVSEGVPSQNILSESLLHLGCYVTPFTREPCFLLPGISLPSKVSLHWDILQQELKEKFLVTSSSGNSDQVDGSGEPAPENQLIWDSTRCGTGSSWFCSTSFQLFQGQEGINIPDKVLKQNVTLNTKCPP